VSIVVEILVGAAATYISRIEKQLNVATVSIPIALPIGVFSAIGAGIATILMFKFGLLLLALLFFLLTKLKFLIGAKLVAILGSFIATLLGIAAGPIGWVLIAFAVFVFGFALLGAIKETFLSVYRWFFRTFAELLLWVRRTSDALREWLYRPLRPLVLVLEVPVVCGTALFSLWEIMNWLGTRINFGQQGTFFRCICLLPFTVFTYRAYIRDTTPPGDGGEGLDVPLPHLLPPSH
jgi:hypothetical protein